MNGHHGRIVQSHAAMELVKEQDSAKEALPGLEDVLEMLMKQKSA